MYSTYKKLVFSLVWIELHLLFSCSTERSYKLQFEFLDQSDINEVAKTIIWVLEKEATCRELISNTVRPREIVTYSFLEIAFPPDSTQKQISFPNKPVLLFAEGQHQSEKAFLRACEEVKSDKGSMYVILKMRRFCIPTSDQEIPNKLVDGDCDGKCDVKAKAGIVRFGDNRVVRARRY